VRAFVRRCHFSAFGRHRCASKAIPIPEGGVYRLASIVNENGSQRGPPPFAPLKLTSVVGVLA
jgi:hypothetical protein